MGNGLTGDCTGHLRLYKYWLSRHATTSLPPDLWSIVCRYIFRAAPFYCTQLHSFTPIQYIDVSSLERQHEIHVGILPGLISVNVSRDGKSVWNLMDSRVPGEWKFYHYLSYIATSYPDLPIDFGGCFQ